MEFDQLIFQRIIRFYKKKRKLDPAISARTVELSEIKPKLTILARALTGRAIDVLPASRDGGWQDNTFYLPQTFSILDSLEENISYYIYRVCYLYIQQTLNHNWSPGSEHSPGESQKKANESAQTVLDKLFGEFPSLISFHELLKKKLESLALKDNRKAPVDYSWCYGHWMKNHSASSGDALEHINKYQKEKSESQSITEIEAKAADEVETIQVDKKTQEEYTLSHHFEKVETAEEFNGVWRDFDGDDTLADDEEALSELTLKHTVRVDDPVHSVYRAEFSGNLTVAESKDVDFKGHFIPYPEWSYTMRKYKANHCKVYPESAAGINQDYYYNTIQKNGRILRNLRKRFAQMDNALEQVRRQASGDEFDIDAVTDMYSDIMGNHTPDEKIYLSKRKRKKDLSILFLLDLSLSSDSYTAGNRVLDIEKQVVILLGEVLNENDVEFEIDGFSSKTRNYCSYYNIKSFSEKWSKGRFNVGAVEPSGYTRIGPAIRHAGARLHQQSSRKKWLVLLSDGKPNDYDKYEGQYGIQDVKQALRELHANNINTYAVAIEDQARYYLPQMFGQNHYNILTSPMEMVHALAKLYERIERG